MKRGRVVGWLALGALAFVVALIPQVPASFIAYHAGQQLAAHRSTLSLHAPEGNVLQGGLQVAIAGESAGRLSWQWQPVALLVGEARVALTWVGPQAGNHARAGVAFGPRRVFIRRLDAGLDAALLARWLPTLAIAGPQARVTVRSDEFVVKHSGKSLDAVGAVTALVNDAAIVQSAIKPLGSYRVALAGEGEQIALKIDTAKGPLDVRGTGELKARERGRFNGALKVAADADAATRVALQPILQNVGQPGADGSASLALTLPALLPGS